MTIAAAQTSPQDGDIVGNLNQHYALINLAVSNRVQLIAFPEMFITVYIEGN